MTIKLYNLIFGLFETKTDMINFVINQNNTLVYIFENTFYSLLHIDV